MKSNISKLFLKNLPKDYSIDKLDQLIKLKTGCSPNIEIIQNKKNPNNGLARLAPFSKKNEITIKQRLSNNFDFENRRISIDIYDKQKKENKKKNFLQSVSLLRHKLSTKFKAQKKSQIKAQNSNSMKLTVKQKKNKWNFDEYTSVFDEQEQKKSEDFHNQNKNFSEKQKQKNEKEKKIEKESNQEKRKNNKKNKQNKQNEKKQHKTTKIARTGSTPNDKNPQNNDYSNIPKNEKNLINDQKIFFSKELQNHQQFTIFMHNISYQANYEKISLLLKKYIQFSTVSFKFKAQTFN
ncbi:hypothetical protein M0812_11386 [Anaeramoeba flamelloides]|uniref:RRM domain-containing protein n=1 Tax=Anaeramoeba flamelloides TaxID=1746091 RepID=A0AAV7ZZY4_9EUKA|nr:hypothetical protein M0812_11386 [Anaeramoeba flamelloides]